MLILDVYRGVIHIFFTDFFTIKGEYTKTHEIMQTYIPEYCSISNLKSFSSLHLSKELSIDIFLVNMIEKMYTTS